MKETEKTVKESRNIGAIIGSLVVGAALGSVIALLTTPQKGKDLRKKISGKTDEFTDSLKAKFNSLLKEAKDEYETEIDKAKREAKAAKENSKDFAGTIKS